jgi:hypothetical protein
MSILNLHIYRNYRIVKILQICSHSTGADLQICRSAGEA